MRSVKLALESSRCYHLLWAFMTQISTNRNASLIYRSKVVLNMKKIKTAVVIYFCIAILLSIKWEKCAKSRKMTAWLTGRTIFMREDFWRISIHLRHWYCKVGFASTGFYMPVIVCNRSPKTQWCVWTAKRNKDKQWQWLNESKRASRLAHSLSSERGEGEQAASTPFIFPSSPSKPRFPHLDHF